MPKQQSQWTGIAAAMDALKTWEWNGYRPIETRSNFLRKPDSYYARKARNEANKRKRRKGRR